MFSRKELNEFLVTVVTYKLVWEINFIKIQLIEKIPKPEVEKNVIAIQNFLTQTELQIKSKYNL